MDDYRLYIHKSRYARFIDSKNRRENWDETVQRLIDFYCKKFPEHAPVLNNGIRDNILSMNVMPSMRSMMTAGAALEKDNICGYNCSYIAVDNIKCFSEALYILMNGCFHPDTEIRTKLGNKRISDMTPDDEVLNFNIETGEFVFTNPLWVIPTPHSNGKDKLELEFEDGTIIKCTADHEFYTTNRGWVKAKDLADDDDIKNYHEV